MKLFCCVCCQPAQRLAQLERDNQQLRRELDQARRLLAAPDRPALDAALESGLKVHTAWQQQDFTRM